MTRKCCWAARKTYYLKIMVITSKGGTKRKALFCYVPASQSAKVPRCRTRWKPSRYTLPLFPFLFGAGHGICSPSDSLLFVASVLLFVSPAPFSFALSPAEGIQRLGGEACRTASYEIRKAKTKELQYAKIVNESGLHSLFFHKECLTIPPSPYNFSYRLPPQHSEKKGGLLFHAFSSKSIAQQVDKQRVYTWRFVSTPQGRMRWDGVVNWSSCCCCLLFFTCVHLLRIVAIPIRVDPGSKLQPSSSEFRLGTAAPLRLMQARRVPSLSYGVLPCHCSSHFSFFALCDGMDPWGSVTVIHSRSAAQHRAYEIVGNSTLRPPLLAVHKTVK
eukprot:gene8303-5818_t